jgi:predicted secreted protein
MRSILLALLLAPLAANAQAPETLFNLVSLNAQAEREVPNDLLAAVLAAEAEGTDTAQLSSDVNRVMQRALAVAKGYGSVKARSGGYNTFPTYEKGRIVRWRVRQELRLESTDIAAATELIGKLQANLVVNGMGLSVSPEVRRQTENALLGEALAAFEERARLVRDAMKAKGYRVRDVQISGGGAAAPMPMYMLARPASAELRAQPAVEPGTSRIVISVSGTVQLQ